MNNLNGKIALVCGASSGIGFAIAKKLAELNCKVILLARSEQKLKNNIQELNQINELDHDYIVADLSNHAYLEQQMQIALKKHGTIHILINNSGGPKFLPIIDAEIKDFEQAFQHHLFAYSLLTRSLLPGMKAVNFGRIINITSTSVKVPIPGLGISNTTRWAVTAWAKTLSLEIAKFGITVNSVLPGYIETDRFDEIIKAKAATEHCQIEDIKKQWESSIPCQRIGTPAEVASAVAFLATPEASYINGVALPVDGGRTGCI